MLADQKYNQIIKADITKSKKEPEKSKPSAEPDDVDDPKPSGSQTKRTKRQRDLDAKKKKKQEEEVEPYYKSRAQREKELQEHGKIVGKLPPPPKHQDFRPIDLPFGFSSLGEYNRLQTYLLWNGPFLVKTTPADGACLFHSLVEMMDCEQEYTQIHARRQIILIVAQHPEFFYELLKEDIEAEYGDPKLSEEEVQDLIQKGEYTSDIKRKQDLPGPFTFVGWMRYMLQGDSWGDAAVLRVLPYMFQCPLITINASTLVAERYRNSLPLPQQDLVFIYVNRNHYMGAGEYKSYLYSAAIVNIVRPEIHHVRPCLNLCGQS